MDEASNRKGVCRVTLLTKSRSLLLAAAILTAACLCLPAGGAPAQAAEPDRVKMVVSILPQVWFAERIGGGDVEVSVLLGPGQSPATFDPSARQMAALLEAELFVVAGVPFENGLLPKIRRLPDGPAIAEVPVPESVAGRESGGHESAGHDHDHDGIDPHTWLAPRQAQALADTMCAALCRLRPAWAPRFQARSEVLRQELTSLDRQIAELLAPWRGREFFVFHPAFGHFAAAYGLTQVAIEAGGHEPGARHMTEIIERAKDAGATAIVVQPQFSRRSAEAVARSLGVEVIALDPLAVEYDANLLLIARTLGEHFAASDHAHRHREQAP